MLILPTPPSPLPKGKGVELSCASACLFLFPSLMEGPAFLLDLPHLTGREKRNSVRGVGHPLPCERSERIREGGRGVRP